MAKTTTAGPVLVATGTTLLTLLQAAPLVNCKLREWQIQPQGYVAASPGVFELIQTDTAATVTAFNASDITCQGCPESPTPATFFTLSTTGSGFTSTSENTIATVRSFDDIVDPPTNQYIRTWDRSDCPIVAAGSFLRIRCLTAASVLVLVSFALEVG